MDFLKNHIEGLIFCSPTPLKETEINNCLTEMFETKIPEKDIEDAIAHIKEKFENDNFSFELIKVGGGYQFLTKPAYKVSIEILLKHQSKQRLSISVLETLSIIAYKQPVTRLEVEKVRGVNCDYSIKKLLKKELIEIKGKADTIGHPIVYGTSNQFMDYFGINDVSELPIPKDFTKIENEVGEEEVGEEKE